MATPNIVPRSDSEGGLGTASKYWASAYIDNIFVGAGFVGRDSDNLIDFSTDDTMTFKLNGANRLIFDSLRLYPNTADGYGLGLATHGFSDLFLAHGAVINFNNGNFLLTHSNNRLTIADSDELAFGNGDDLRIYHNATNSNIENFNGDLQIIQTVDDKDIVFRCDDGSGGHTAYITLDGSDTTIRVDKKLVLPDDIKTTFGAGEDLRIFHEAGGTSKIENYTGNLVFQQRADDADIVFQCDDGSGGLTEYLRLDGSNTRTNVHKFMRFDDSIKAEFGGSADLQIFHDGTHGQIVNNSSKLFIKNNANDEDIVFESDNGAGGTATYFFLDGSSATHDGSATTGLFTNWPDSSKISLGTSHDLQISHNGSNSVIQQMNNATGDLIIKQSVDDGDIVFQCDDGSGSVTDYIRLDGNAVNIKVYKDIRFQDDEKAEFGTTGDLQIFHNGTNSNITNKTGTLFINQDVDDGDIIFRSDDGTGGVAEYFRLDGSDVKTIFSQPIHLLDNKKLILGTGSDFVFFHDGGNSNITNATGNITVTNNADDGDIIFSTDDGSGNSATYLFLDGSNTQTVFQKNTVHQDNIEARFGNGSDLRIYHDGTDTYINNANGNLQIKNSADDKDIEFLCDDGTGNNAQYFKLDGSLGGGDGAGTLFTIWPDNSRIGLGSNADLRMYHDGTDTKLLNLTGNVIIQNNANDKDISFSNDDGAGAAVTYFRLDGSAATHNGSVTTNVYTNWPDASNISLGSSHDFTMKHDGTNTTLRNLTGNLQIQQASNDADIIFTCDDGSGGETEYFRVDGGAEFVKFSKQTVHIDSVKAEFGGSGDLAIQHNGTDSLIDNYTGDLYITQHTNDKDIIFRSDDGSGGTTTYIKLDGSEVQTHFSKNTKHGDGVAARFGDGNDFVIKHDGTTTLLQNNTGILEIKQELNDGDIKFKSDDGSGGTATYVTIDGGATKTLFHKNTEHQDNVSATFGDTGDLGIHHDGTDSFIANLVGDLKISNSQDDGDILFQTDNGSGGVTTYIQLDGSEVSTKILTQKVIMTNLPTSDPGNSGQLWNDNGTLKISVG